MLIGRKQDIVFHRTSYGQRWLDSSNEKKSRPVYSSSWLWAPFSLADDDFVESVEKSKDEINYLSLSCSKWQNGYGIFCRLQSNLKFPWIKKKLTEENDRKSKNLK